MDVVVVGSCMTDLISYVPRLPKPGETLHGERFAIGFGGKGANQCIVSSRLGAKTAMVAKVGNDTFGNNYIQNFRDNGVNIEHVSTTPEAATGVAPIAVSEDGQNAIVIVSGANLKLTETDVQRSEGLISSARVVVCQLEIKPDVTITALKLAKKHNVVTIFNPAPALAHLDPSFYVYSDFLCVNETEAEILTGIPVSCPNDSQKVISCLLERGCKAVIVTLGSQGSVFATHENPLLCHIPATSVTAVDSTGAGDAFIGALAFYLSTMPNLQLEDIIRRSGKIASASVELPGTQTSYQWQKDLPTELFS